MRYAFRTLLAALLVTTAWSCVDAQADSVKKDLQEVADRADRPFEQREREDAMRRLGQSGDAEALACLVRLLNDPFVHIRTSAEGILATATGDATATLLAKGINDKSAEVRRRAARVLGRRNAGEAVEPLARLLRTEKDDSVRVASIRALGCIARRGSDSGAVGALEKLLKAGDSASGAAAHELGLTADVTHAPRIADVLKSKSPVAVIGACDGLAALGAAQDHAEALAKAARDKDWRVRIASAQALGRSSGIPDDELYRKTFASLLADDDWRVRRRVIEALVDLWQPLAAQLLVERIQHEQGALVMDIVHALEDLTGTRQSYLPQAWVNWWQGIGSKRPLGLRKPRPEHGWLRTPREGGTDQDGAGATASYFKIPVFAQPCTFAFDMSGSMREAVSRDNPKLRVDVAREELARTLKQLPEGTPFNIVIYRYYSEFPPQTEVQRAFAKGVQPLSARNAESAVNWLAGLKALGWGALYENLAAAVEDPEPQVIYFLSDGAPSRGEYVDRDEMVAAVAELRRFRPLVIHCVLVGGGNRDVEFMTALAASSAGRMADARK